MSPCLRRTFPRWRFKCKAHLAFTLCYSSWKSNIRRKLSVLLYNHKQKSSTESTVTHIYLDYFSAHYPALPTTLALSSHPMTASIQNQENKYPLCCSNYQLLLTYQFPPLLSRSGFPESIHITTD